MISRKLALLLLAGLVCNSGCRTSTSNRVTYATQPAVVGYSPAPVVVAPAPVAVVAPAQAPCSSCPNAGTVPPPPPGFVR